MRETMIHRVVIYRNSSAPGSDIEWRHIGAFDGHHGVDDRWQWMLFHSLEVLTARMNGYLT